MGKSLVHLQCHFGLDTLAWARHGARVAGLDFFGPAVEAARLIPADIGVPEGRPRIPLMFSLRARAG